MQVGGPNKPEGEPPNLKWEEVTTEGMANSALDFRLSQQANFVDPE